MKKNRVVYTKSRRSADAVLREKFIAFTLLALKICVMLCIEHNLMTHLL